MSTRLERPNGLEAIKAVFGTVGDMDPRLVKVFEKHGFKWGGDWKGRSRDPMHFQYATGY